MLLFHSLNGLIDNSIHTVLDLSFLCDREYGHYITVYVPEIYSWFLKLSTYFGKVLIEPKKQKVEKLIIFFSLITKVM